MARDLSAIREHSIEDGTSNIVSNTTAPSSKKKVSLERKKKIKEIAMDKRQRERINENRKRERRSLNSKAKAYGKSLFDKNNWSQAAALRMDTHNDIADLNMLVKDLDSCHKSKMGALVSRIKQMDNTSKGGRKTRKNKRGRRRQKTRKMHR